jgi:glycopeptide antibiotics resistance protein
MARRLLVGWIAVIALLVLPWTTFQAHSHWNNVDWIPFVGRHVRLRDNVANVLLYMPLGYLSRRQRFRIRTWQVGLFGFALSVLTEFTQVYSHGRFPSATDVVCNTIGAVLGAAFARAAG